MPARNDWTLAILIASVFLYAAAIDDSLQTELHSAEVLADAIHQEQMNAAQESRQQLANAAWGNETTNLTNR